MRERGANVEGEFYSVREAAAELQISEATLRRRIKSGKIKADLVSGVYGLEYQIPIEEIHPAYQTVEVVEIENQLTMDDFRQAMSSEMKLVIQTAMGEYKHVTTSLLEAQKILLEEQTEQIKRLTEKIDRTEADWQEKERLREELIQKKKPWYKRMIGD